MRVGVVWVCRLPANWAVLTATAFEDRVSGSNSLNDNRRAAAGAAAAAAVAGGQHQHPHPQVLQPAEA